MSLSLVTRGYAGGGGGTPDPDAPSLAVVSPTPGVAPGQPGGFPLDPAEAASTEIVLHVTDMTPGTVYLVVTARFGSSSDEEVVYRRGNFRGPYVAGSTQSAIADGVELRCLRAGGWPSTSQLVFEIDALDGDGNIL